MVFPISLLNDINFDDGYMFLAVAVHHSTYSRRHVKYPPTLIKAIDPSRIFVYVLILYQRGKNRVIRLKKEEKKKQTKVGWIRNIE